MFQFKNTGLGVKEPDNSNTLPNTFGKVRTFKEDLQNFEKGASAKDNIPEETISLPPEATKPLVGAPPSKQELPQPMPAVPKTESAPNDNNPFQSIPTPAPIPSSNSELPPFKSSPSQSFFAENQPAKTNVLPGPENQSEQPAPQNQKKKSSFMLPLVILLVLAIAGAGFYYYWFNVRSNPSVPVSTSAAPATPPSAPSAPASPQNKNLRNLLVDTSQGATGIRGAIQKFATDFSTSAAENDLVEVKIIGKDEQPIGKKDFFSGVGIAVPDSVLMKLSEDYSLFARKESGSVRLGFVFKTVTSSGLADEMKNWEPTLETDLAPLYIGQAPTGTGIFSSSQYKNADIRYFNFSSPTDTSLDYSVISNFLVIGSSKDTTRAILDYMSEK